MAGLDLAGCPTDCGRRVQPGQLMCRRCWAQVPGFIQREVYDTWRVYRAKALAVTGLSGPANDERRDARKAYGAAVDKALAAVA